MIEFVSSRNHRRRAGVRYLMAALAVVAALILTSGLKQLFRATPIALYFCAIAFSAWFGGLGPGIVASVLASLAAHFTPAVVSPVDTATPRHILFLLVGVFISWLIEQQSRAQAALQQARDQLEDQGHKRTRELMVA